MTNQNDIEGWSDDDLKDEPAEQERRRGRAAGSRWIERHGSPDQMEEAWHTLGNRGLAGLRTMMSTVSDLSEDNDFGVSLEYTEGVLDAVLMAIYERRIDVNRARSNEAMRRRQRR